MVFPSQVFQDPPYHLPTNLAPYFSFDLYLKNKYKNKNPTKQSKEKIITKNKYNKHTYKDWKSLYTRRPGRQKWPKQSNMRNEVHKNIIELDVCWPSAAELAVCPRTWLLYTVRLHWRKLIFPLYVDVSWRYLLGSRWSLVCGNLGLTHSNNFYLQIHLLTISLFYLHKSLVSCWEINHFQYLGVCVLNLNYLYLKLFFFSICHTNLEN